MFFINAFISIFFIFPDIPKARANNKKKVDISAGVLEQSILLFENPTPVNILYTLYNIHNISILNYIGYE